jgi:fructose-specific phosphotransferase system IIC component
MALVSRSTLVGIALLSFAGMIAGFAAVWFGFYVAADDPHTRPFYWLLENVRDRSIAGHDHRH